MLSVALLWSCNIRRSAKSQHLLAGNDLRSLRRGDLHRPSFAGQQRETVSPRTALPTPAAPISFSSCLPATYTVTVEAAGFAPQSKSIELLINQPATLNFSLPVEAAATTVSVSGQAPALNSTDATMGDAFDSATIQALPVEGDIPDLLSLQPGVLYLGLHNDQSHDSRSGSAAGARSDQNNSTLDGLDNNDQVRGYAFTGVLRSTLDSVQEFRVTTSGFNADTGRSSGAQINIATKSGTNDFHGSVYGRTRNLITPANDWFNKQAELAQGLAQRSRHARSQCLRRVARRPHQEEQAVLLHHLRRREDQRKPADDDDCAHRVAARRRNQVSQHAQTAPRRSSP